MITSSPEWSIIEYNPNEPFTKVGEFFIPSGDEMDRHFKKDSMRSVTMKDKPKNMYRWGTIKSSHLLSLGTRVYYSQYDAEEFIYKNATYNVVLNKHLLAEETT